MDAPGNGLLLQPIRLEGWEPIFQPQFVFEIKDLHFLCNSRWQRTCWLFQSKADVDLKSWKSQNLYFLTRISNRFYVCGNHTRRGSKTLKVVFMIPRKGASLELSSPRWKKKHQWMLNLKNYIYKTIDVILRASCLLSLYGRGKSGPVKNLSLWILSPREGGRWVPGSIMVLLPSLLPLLAVSFLQSSL